MIGALSTIRVLGGALGLAALVAIGWLVQDRFHQKEIADDARACSIAAQSELDDLSRCLPQVRNRLEAERRSHVCSTALLQDDSAASLFAVRNSCSAGVKRLHAQREAATNNLADVQSQLDTVRADSLSAIARAEARATNQNERKRRADNAIKAAPVDRDGLNVCDADCLRGIAGG